MAMPIIPADPYPNVPDDPGVPVLRRSDTANYGDPVTFERESDSIIDFSDPEPVRWGIFNAAGELAISPDTVLGMEFSNSFRISDYPQEQGAFAAYNKVNTPYTVRMQLACSGSINLRADFIADMDFLVKSLDLYTVVTPEVSYLNANIEAWSYRRETTNGANMIIADVVLREIRESAIAAFSAPKSASAADKKSGGQVQAKPTTATPAGVQ